MAKNYIQRGDVLTIPAPANTLSGEPIIIGELRGVALGNAAETAPLDVQTEGVFELPKVAADAFDIGDSVFYDSATKLVKATGADPAKLGYAVTGAAASSATVNVKLA
jgi:predicted RecA/RadA family phage recombinase